MFGASCLWMEADRARSALPLLRMSAKIRKPEIDWLSIPRNTCMVFKRMEEAARVMEVVIARDAKPDYLHNGGILQPRMNAPDRAPPRPPRLSRPPSPEADWFAALGHAWMKSSDPAKAEAMERDAAISEKPKHACQAGAPRPRFQ